MSSDHSSNIEDSDTATADRHSKRERKRQEKVQHQAEIEARTNAGESCKQIAAALQANGHKISDKTIARWRVQWGHRQRATRNTKGQPLRAPRLTRDGKSAEEIFEILQAQGVVMKKGVSTVWRLQTYWKLIPFDSDRANGTGPYSKWKTQPCRQKTDKRRVPKADRPPTAKKAKEGDSTVQVADGIVLHYPTNCAFGPQKRRPGASQTELDPGLRLGAAADPMHIDSDSEPDPGFYNELGGDDLEMGCDHEVPRDRGREVQSPKHWQQQTSTYPNTHAAAQPTQPSATFTGGTDVMSAQLLVDLANSALVAATDLKDLVLAVQMRRPARNSMSASPPSAEDIMKARRRVREAASVVVELAMG